MRAFLWHNRSWKARTAIILTALVIVGAASSNSSSPDAKSSEATAAPAKAPAKPKLTGVVRGYFSRSLFDGPIDEADLEQYIKTTRVFCGWRDGKVEVHVRMANESAVPVSVIWSPRYTIQAGGIHGESLLGTEKAGFDAGEIRNLISIQEPKGVPVGTPISECSPHFQTIDNDG